MIYMYIIGNREAHVQKLTLYSMERRISVVSMRQEASGRICTSPVRRPTSLNVWRKSRNCNNMFENLCL